MGWVLPGRDGCPWPVFGSHARAPGPRLCLAGERAAGAITVWGCCSSSVPPRPGGSDCRAPSSVPGVLHRPCSPACAGTSGTDTAVRGDRCSLNLPGIGETEKRIILAKPLTYDIRTVFFGVDLTFSFPVPSRCRPSDRDSPLSEATRGDGEALPTHSWQLVTDNFKFGRCNEIVSCILTLLLGLRNVFL